VDGTRNLTRDCCNQDMRTFWPSIVAMMTALAILITLVIWLRQHYTSRPRYRAHVGQPAKMEEMREEQRDATEDANASRYHDDQEHN
jgi:hypothetical protein